MNDLLITFREKGKKKGFIFNEKQIKEENVRVNIELQNFIKNNLEAQKLINLLKENNIKLKKQKEVLMNTVSSEDKNKINSTIQVIIEENSQHQNRVKKNIRRKFK